LNFDSSGDEVRGKRKRKAVEKEIPNT